ncbi:MAG: cupredoxin domain-containing protein [Actinomycetota bacterium]|nr:cupredoxin domain-containing protein [Actinomycetota bacterium]
MTKLKTTGADAIFIRYAVIALLVLVAFFASYRFALAARGGVGTTGTGPVATSPVGVSDSASASDSPACACCGDGSGSSTPVEGAAAVDADGVQRITVSTDGSYDPNVIKLAAGVPAEITFNAASGCMAQVMSKDLGFFEDLTSGDKTIKLDGLAAGTYEFSCGMQMVFGQIVVE